MKQVCILLSVIGFIAMPLMAQNQLSDWDRDNLKGKVQKVTMTEMSGGTSQQTIFEYDTQGNLISKTIGDYVWIPITDDEFRNHTSLWLGYENGLTDIMVHTYDSTGRIIESKMFEISSHTMTIATKYIYDSTGLTEISVNVNHSQSEIIEGYSESIFRYKNTPDGNAVEEEANGKTKTFKYVFDNKGNWIRKDVYVDGKKSYYFERLIRYYN